MRAARYRAAPRFTLGSSVRCTTRVRVRTCGSNGRISICMTCSMISRTEAGLDADRSARDHHASNTGSPFRDGAKRSMAHGSPHVCWMRVMLRSNASQGRAQSGSGPRRAGIGVAAMSTRPRTWSGYVEARSMAAAPPSDVPLTNARVDPTVRNTQRASLMVFSSVDAPWIRSESPTPRLSKMITRAWRPSSSKKAAYPGSSHEISRCDTKPGMKSRSTGPLPTT